MLKETVKRSEIFIFEMISFKYLNSKFDIVIQAEYSHGYRMVK
jgi:hypothetical protein